MLLQHPILGWNAVEFPSAWQGRFCYEGDLRAESTFVTVHFVEPTDGGQWMADRDFGGLPAWEGYTGRGRLWCYVIHTGQGEVDVPERIPFYLMPGRNIAEPDDTDHTPPPPPRVRHANPTGHLPPPPPPRPKGGTVITLGEGVAPRTKAPPDEVVPKTKASPKVGSTLPPPSVPYKAGPPPGFFAAKAPPPKAPVPRQVASVAWLDPNTYLDL
jgi:hypothetical protein